MPILGRLSGRTRSAVCCEKNLRAQGLHNLGDLHHGLTVLPLQAAGEEAVFEVPAGVEGHDAQCLQAEPDEALKAVAINEQSRIPEVKFRIFRNSGTLHGKLLLPVDEPLAVTALASPLGLVAQAEEELLVGQDRQSRQSCQNLNFLVGWPSRTVESLNFKECTLPLQSCKTAVYRSIYQSINLSIHLSVYSSLDVYLSMYVN